MTLFDVAKEITRRLASAFLPDANGRRPIYGGTAKFQNDPQVGGWDLTNSGEFRH
jgi:hypothetical protein